MKKFTFYRQSNYKDCGPTCLRMIARYYGRHYTIETLRQMTSFDRQGVSLYSISQTAEKIGFHTHGVKLNFEKLTEIKLPCILHWEQRHFVVLLEVSSRKGKQTVKIADPSHGIITYSKNDFIRHWQSSQLEDGVPVGIALLIDPTNNFYKEKGEKETGIGWSYLTRYLTNNRWQIVQVFIALLITSLLQLIFPFLTQSIVDVGINTRNIQFIVLVLVAQLMLIFSRTVIDFIRGRLLLYISSILNISILSDFWIKMTRLPIAYFDVRHTGDTLQRIGDHRVLQNFLTNTAFSTFFSLFNFGIFAIVLVMYNVSLFFIFIAGSALYLIWIRIFLKIRRKLNYESFGLMAKENTATLQMILGMQELRLNNAEQARRWDWENIQAGLFKLNFTNLTYNQVQAAGALFISQGKDILITFVVANLVIEGRLTVGAMLAIQYIVGQLSGPVEQFVGFVQNGQDAKISMERLNEIHQMSDEEEPERIYQHRLPEDRSLSLKNVSFAYNNGMPVLNSINLVIPEGKVTAIVGDSGSGKTTILKVLLKFFDNYTGDIKVGESNFRYFSPSFWRSQCGAVLQDGFIFNDTIAGNIAVGKEDIDLDKLIWCCRVTNILSFVESLPNGFSTQLGAEGTGLSQGQKQRILIARAIYKDPQYLFFDEATNALDSNNERTIVENLHHIFKNRTVVVVAHRLSTVRNADKIIVLSKGEIIEEGTHRELSARKGRYYDLVKNQLELDN